MMLRYSLHQPRAADAIESAVGEVLSDGLRTADILSEGTRRVGTREMGDAVSTALARIMATG
jgi:3-isopropylmalate dehydrogenase